MASIGTGFWSYVHDDDEGDGGRLADLARDVVKEYEAQTADSIELFLDRDSLEWGAAWEGRIDEQLNTVIFFVPVITPRYFTHPQCRREMQHFANGTRKLGVQGLILPLLYIDFPNLHDNSSTDQLIQLVRTFQWEDWTALRFAERTSSEYRSGVARLAGRLVVRNSAIESQNAPDASLPEADPGHSPEPAGTLDLMADAERAMPEWSETVAQITNEIETVGEIMRSAGERVNSKVVNEKGFAGRIAVIRQVSAQLQTPAQSLMKLANDFTSQLYAVDVGIRTIAAQASIEVATDPDATQAYCEFFGNVRNLSRRANAGLTSAGKMIDAIDGILNQSRDLRPQLRTIKQAIEIVREGRLVTDSWEQLIDESGIECEEGGV